jgi:Haem-NO-binding
MKGVVFTEFLEMVEDHFSLRMVDEIIEEAAVPSAGAYTAVGTYPHEEMVALVTALSRRSGMALPDLLHAFGRHLFGRFVRLYPRFFQHQTDALTFMAGIEDIIHAEVLKLYPDAQLPRFDVEAHDYDRLVLIYHSPRHMPQLAMGLIEGCIDHFGQSISVRSEPVGEGMAGSVRFELLRHA